MTHPTNPLSLSYGTAPATSPAGTAVVSVLSGLSVAGAGCAFYFRHGFGLSLFLTGVVASLLNIPALRVFRKRIPRPLAVLAWILAGLGLVAAALVAFDMLTLAVWRLKR